MQTTEKLLSYEKCKFSGVEKDAFSEFAYIEAVFECFSTNIDFCLFKKSIFSRICGIFNL